MKNFWRRWLTFRNLLPLVHGNHWVLGHISEQGPFLQIVGSFSLPVVMGWIQDGFSILPVVNTYTWGSTFLCESSFCPVGQKPALNLPLKDWSWSSLRVYFPHLCPASCIYPRWTPFKAQKHFKEGQDKWKSPESWSSNVVAEPKYSKIQLSPCYSAVLSVDCWENIYFIFFFTKF